MPRPHAKLRLGVVVPVMILSTSTNGVSRNESVEHREVTKRGRSTSSGRRCPHATANYKKWSAEI